MKTTKYFLFFLFAIMQMVAHGQIVSWSPNFPTVDDSITIIYDATRGNQALKDSNRVYIHTGAVTASATSPIWTSTQGNWGTDDPHVKMTKVGNNKFKIRFQIRSFYGIPATGVTVYRLGMVFRNLTGSKVGKTAQEGDIFIPIYQAGVTAVSIRQPDAAFSLLDSNATVNVTAVSSKVGQLSIYVNGVLKKSATDSAIQYQMANLNPGLYRIRASYSTGAIILNDSVSVLVKPVQRVIALPANLHSGVNYLSDSSVILVLHAPLKQNAFAIGDFNNWVPDSRYFMNKTPDGRKFWLQIDHLTTGFEYAYQYLIDGQSRFADAYCEKIVDPANDFSISNLTYPNKKFYPRNKTTGIVSVFQTGRLPYQWQATNYSPPAKERLTVYELHLRDFLQTNNYKTLTDTLNYFTKLGINCIELMPVMEFEGNDSWGYNPNFHAALDKAYGTPDVFRAFVDSCHKRGIAVVLDIALNHAFNSSPLAQMYWDDANSQPAANSPFFNAVAKHPFNVGNDFNHESPDTREYVDYVLAYWLKQFKVDGFRFDLSKGFTQFNSGTNVGLWGNYDQSRINNLNRIMNVMYQTNPNAYVILEHFADNSEETVLASNYMLWTNLNYAFNQASMGYLSGSDVNSLSYKNKGWSKPSSVGYFESHDEERLMYKNETYGRAITGYSAKDTTTALNRMKAAFAFLLMTPGPKMFWQFGELGYDFALNRCQNGTINNNCRTYPKPVRWDYFTVPARRSLFNTVSALIDLKKKDAAFSSSNFALLAGDNIGGKRITITGTGSLMVLTNFDVNRANVQTNWPVNGKWYDYFTGDSLTVTQPGGSVSLGPGEFKVYSTTKYPKPNLVAGVAEQQKAAINFVASPNPSKAGVTFGVSGKRNGVASLIIRNIQGKEITRVIAQDNGSDEFNLYWDGNSAQGLPVAAGIYLAEFITENSRQVVKIIRE